MLGVYAGTTEFYEISGDLLERTDIEFGCGVTASGNGRAIRRQQPVRTNDRTRTEFSDDQVVAPRVQGIDVEVGVRQRSSPLTGKHLVTQPLGSGQLVLGYGEPDFVASLGIGVRDGRSPGVDCCGRRGG